MTSETGGGQRVFKHNNCLPCKNMVGTLTPCNATGQFEDVKKHYPDYFAAAQELSKRLTALHGKEIYWGRETDFDGHCKLCED
jgi:hypothetical protein